MICPGCGRDNLPDVSYCQTCGTLMTAPPSCPSPAYGYNYQQQGFPPPAQSYPQPIGTDPANYGDIGSRFLAALIDVIILGIPVGIVAAAWSAMMAARMIQRSSIDGTMTPGMAADTIGTFFAGFGFVLIISVLSSWAYYAILESSAWQGTVGKKIMGLKVTDLAGERISVGRATLRLAVKAFLSGWFLIGYIMALFTQKKQSLHDLIAGTLVLTRKPNASGYQQGYPQPYPQQYQGNYPQASSQNNVPQSAPPYFPQSPSSCLHCGAQLQPNARFCSNCGRAV